MDEPAETTFEGKSCSGDDEENDLRFMVDRPVCSQRHLNRLYQKPDQGSNGHSTISTLKDRLKTKLHPKNLCLSLLGQITFLTWIPSYRWKKDLLRDFIAGLTVGVMHIPQGMAYALLTDLNPIYGIYVSFIAGVVYFMFGTSKHISVGPTAFIALMVGEAIQKIIDIDSLTLTDSTQGNMTAASETDVVVTSILPAVTCVTLIAALTQIIMSVLNLGFLTNYLSNTFVSGYTFGVAVHVLTSQVKSAFGIILPRFPGIFSIIYTYKELVMRIDRTNIATLLLFIVSVLIINIIKYLNKRYHKTLKFPLPTELIIVVAGTLVSYLAKLNMNYNIDNIGQVPTGLPPPSIPDVSNILLVIGDGIAIGFVSFSMTISVSKMFARKYRYDIDANQELLTLGICNLLCSFFSGYVCSTSMSRSSVQESVGGRTQLADLISSALLLVVMLAIAPAFQTLPKAVLAAVIMSALVPVFFQATILKKLWHSSRYEFFVWLVTVSSVIILGVDLGLFIGVGFSLLTVICRIQAPRSTVLENIPQTEIYLKEKTYPSMVPVDGVLIFRMTMSLFYINVELFQHKLRKLFDQHQKPSTTKVSASENGTTQQVTSTNDEELDVAGINLEDSAVVLDYHLSPIRYIIIDCQPFNFIDLKGFDCLNQIISDYQEENVEILLAGCRENVLVLMERSRFIEEDNGRLFVTVHDAVLYAKHKMNDDGCMKA